MKLTYRGHTYNYNPCKVPGWPFYTNRKPGAAYNLVYRGVTYRIDPNIKQLPAAEQLKIYTLNYRGVTYWVNRNLPEEVTSTITPLFNRFNQKKPLREETF
jgi:Domain of unknown function (DUF4278)